VNVETGDTLMHDFHALILLHTSAVGVGTSRKKNSRKRAPGASPLLGTNGGDRGAPGPTHTRALPHHRKTDLFADGSAMIAKEDGPESFMQGGRPKAGGELISKT
jgi:hypothetical protein